MEKEFIDKQMWELANYVYLKLYFLERRHHKGYGRLK